MSTIVLKKRVKKLCKDQELPDMSSKITSSVYAPNNTVMQVRLGRVYRAMPKTEIPSFDNAVSVYVSKGKSHIGTQVSPFTLCIDSSINTGTVDGTTDGTPLRRGVALELYWQAAKVCPEEVLNGSPTPAYYVRRAQIYAKNVVKRRYIPKGYAIAGAVFGNDPTIFESVPSRKFYCHAYTTSVVKTPAFQLLTAIVHLNIRLLLLGPDAHALRMEESWASAYTDCTKQFGHERVLAVMLTSPQSEWPWIDQDCAVDEEPQAKCTRVIESPWCFLPLVSA
jgi:hypothetical protein